jgi:hypothetical protein
MFTMMAEPHQGKLFDCLMAVNVMRIRKSGRIINVLMVAAFW